MPDDMGEKSTPPKRQYPWFYEKFIPIAIAVLAVAVLLVLGYVIAVGLGIINFG